jgi:hypothetical protein
MDSYDVIDSIRLKDRIGPKPNANSHIIIHCNFECEKVTFWFKEKK